MTTYTWPDTRAFTPQTAQLRVVDGTQRSHESGLSGYTQTQSMPGARWGWGYDFAAQPGADRQQLEGYLLRLSGREHRAALWDLKHPRPAGHISVSGVTLGATASQFANAIQLAGTLAPPNLLQGGSFELAGAVSGFGKHWNTYVSGSTGTITNDRPTGASSPLCQRVIAAALGTTASDEAGLAHDLYIPVTAGQDYALSANIICNSAALSVRLYWDWYNASFGPISGVGTAQAAPTAWTRRSQVGTAPPTAAYARCYIWMLANTAAASDVQLLVDDVQFEPGSAATAYVGTANLVSGDWIGLASGQLVRVVADAQAADDGAMSVSVQHMLRQSVASGSAVVLNKPTALFVRTEAGLTLPRQPGNVEPPLSIEWVEVFA